MKNILKTTTLGVAQAKISLFILILGLSLITLAANQLSALAQTRQPTNAELKKLRQELQQFIRSAKNNHTGAGYLQDRRTQVEKKTRESFVRVWSKTEPELAPFMGIWSGYENSEHIYPSNTKGQVCIVSTGEGYGSFKSGTLSNGLIKTNSGEVLFKEGNYYLGSAFLKNGRFVSNNSEIPLHSPRPIEPLNRLLEYISEASEKNQISQQFKAAGCTSSLPNSSANTQTQSNKQIINEKPNPVLTKKLISIILKDYPGINLETWSDYKPPFSFTEIDLNGDNKKETIVVFRKRSCSNRHCQVIVFNTDKNKETYNLNSEIFTSRNGLKIAVLPTKNYGWYDLAARVFTYQPKDENWRVFRFNGKKYELTEKKLNLEPKRIILSESSREFDLGDFPKK